jgi:hypothetical protein
MIDLKNEHAIGLHEAAKLYPSFRQGKATHISTILRHISKGTRLPSGAIIKLEGARLGGRWITTLEAVQRFMERLTGAALGESKAAEAPIVQTSARRQRDLARTDRELDAARI